MVGPGQLHPVRIEGLPVGLMLSVDEYLTALSQEIGMIRLGGRPSSPGSPGREAIAVVDSVLTDFAAARDAIRASAEQASAAGSLTFDVDVELPLEAAHAAIAMRQALADLRRPSGPGRAQLPPLAEEAAGFFASFLTAVARQVMGEEVAFGLEARRPTGLLPSTLGDRRAEHLVRAPTFVDVERLAVRTYTRDLVGARQARKFVFETLRHWSLDDTARRAELPAGELVANALLHAPGPIEVLLILGESALRVEVHDTAVARPGMRRRGKEADSGRGLLLVDALVERWGFDDASELGKRVWFELDLSDA